ncbi:MAG: hypothetical protein AB8H80_20060 [Planctomycetota bacterium]
MSKLTGRFRATVVAVGRMAPLLMASLGMASSRGHQRLPQHVALPCTSFLALFLAIAAMAGSSVAQAEQSRVRFYCTVSGWG